MKAYRWLSLIAAVLITAFEVLMFVAGSGTANAASPTPCDIRPGVVLTPDVPRRKDARVLSVDVQRGPS